jgi:large subunit ribosomal protein L13
MGKKKPDYSPQTDCGDIVEVSNVEKMKWTGDKLEQKFYYRHSGYPGGIKRDRLDKAMATKPEEVLRNAVSHMLPDNRLRAKMMKRIKFVK